MALPIGSVGAASPGLEDCDAGFVFEQALPSTLVSSYWDTLATTGLQCTYKVCDAYVYTYGGV